MTSIARLREAIQQSTRPRGTPAPGGAVSGRPLRELVYEPVGADGLPPDMRAAGLATFHGASEVETDFGRCVLVTHCFEAESRHGRALVGEADVADDDDLQMLAGTTDGSLDGAAGSTAPPVVFLDLETTGLSGGAGTVAFLVGCGYFDGGAFHTRQYLLPGYGAERALLHAVEPWLTSAARIVTFNGKTFDLPVLETRWLFHRLTWPAGLIRHLDLLHPARRLWGRLGGEEQSCRLTSLEQSLLDFTRLGDVPGWEIPARFFDYVRGSDAGVLAPVLLHNRLDLLSLAVLTARAQRLVRSGPSAATDASECLALGELYERAGRAAPAEACFRVAADWPGAGRSVRAAALRRLAIRLGRGRRHDDAALAWEGVLAIDEAQSAAARDARRALAVHHEHRARDLARARRFALEALLHEEAGSRRDAARFRLARLDRKLSVQGKGGRGAAWLLGDAAGDGASRAEPR